MYNLATTHWTNSGWSPVLRDDPYLSDVAVTMNGRDTALADAMLGFPSIRYLPRKSLCPVREIFEDNILKSSKLRKSPQYSKLG